MKRDWHNVVVSVELIVPTARGAQPEMIAVDHALRDAIKNGRWYHLSELRVVCTRQGNENGILHSVNPLPEEPIR